MLTRNPSDFCYWGFFVYGDLIVSEANIDFLRGVKASSAPIFATLLGFRESVKRTLGIEKFPMVLHNDHKGSVRKAYGNSDMPYGYFRITNLQVDEDSQAASNIRRVGNGSFIDGLNATVNKSYLFAVNLRIECFYVDNDPLRVLNFVSMLALVNQAKGLEFYLELPSGRRHVQVRPDTKGAAIPTTEIDNEDDPFTSSIEFSYEVRGFAGQYVEVAKLNNEGIIDLNVKMAKREQVEAGLIPTFTRESRKSDSNTPRPAPPTKP